MMSPYSWFRTQLRVAPTPREKRRQRPLHLESLEDRCLLSADVVLEWNSLVLDAFRASSADPLILTRSLAMVHGAMYDAVNNVEQTYTPYLVDHPVSADTSEEAAAATAAHRIAVQLFPSQRDMLDTALRHDLDIIPDGHAKRQGIALGKYVATVMLDWRRHDNSDLVVTYPGSDEPGKWRPTPPAYAPAFDPQWPYVTPFTMSSGSQFRAYPPPTLASAEYHAAFDEIRAIGAVDSMTRTPEQTEIALFWEDPGGRTSTPPGHWNRIAATVAEAQGNTLAQNARLFALLALTQADDGIAIMDSKYAFGFWRAVTAIRETVDPNWTPLITTPPHPSYPCAHCTFSTSSAAVLASFFGTDDISFRSTSEGTGVTRSYTSFTQAGDEGGLSRLYGGIHWRFDINAGNGLGRAVADYVLSNFLLPVATAPGWKSDLRILGSVWRAEPAHPAAPLGASAIATVPTSLDAVLVDHLLIPQTEGTNRPVVFAVSQGAHTTLAGGRARALPISAELLEDALAILPGE